MSETTQAANSGRSTISPTDPRVYLAAERTLLAWIRTALAMMGFGFVVARFGFFLRELAVVNRSAMPPTQGLSVWFGVGLVALGVVVALGAGVRHVRYLRLLDQGHLPSHHGRTLAVVVAGLLVCLGILMAWHLLTVS